MKRRDWIRNMGALGMAGAAGLHVPLSAGPFPGRRRHSSGASAIRGEKVRSIIIFALDGTGFEDLATASFFSRRILERPFLYEEILTRGSAGAMLPHSLTSVVTDSAAATMAWSTGRKVVNGALGQFPDGRDLHTILELAREWGKITGFVTSARITHATPAG